MQADIEPSSYDTGGELPASETFAVELQCQEDLNESDNDQLAFGLGENDFYIFERTSTTGIVVMGSANLEGTRSEIWDIRVGDSNTQFLHLTASDDEGMEVTTAGTDTSGGSGATPCGMHFKSNSEYLYLEASLAASGCSSMATYCLDVESLESVAATFCTSANLNQFALTSLTSTHATEAKDNAQAMVDKKISGYVDFTEGAIVEDAPALR